MTSVAGGSNSAVTMGDDAPERALGSAEGALAIVGILYLSKLAITNAWAVLTGLRAHVWSRLWRRNFVQRYGEWAGEGLRARRGRAFHSFRLALPLPSPPPSSVSPSAPHLPLPGLLLAPPETSPKASIRRTQNPNLTFPTFCVLPRQLQQMQHQELWLRGCCGPSL